MTLPRRFLPSIASLRALEALDRLGSATAAAAELSQTQSAVSRQLKTLEDQLGVGLVVRQGRGIHLTPEAADYADKIRGALQQIAQASLKLTTDPAGGSLSLAILPTFGMRWLVPRLAEFARLYPEVTINLSTRLKPFNFVTEPFDAALHFGKHDWLGTEALRLRTERVVAVATPEFLAAHAPIERAADLMRLPLLQIETRPGAWPAWFEAQGVTGAKVSGTIYDQFSTITQAALHGLGVALLPDYLAEQDLATGRFRSAWGDKTLISGAYYLVWPVQNARDPALCKFRDWLAGQAEDEDLLPR
ncbi:Transcriptional regulator, LysR family protein [Roseovarius sp. EC-HK134]|uniref:LysR substrate-binding domain-containing protein n=1 Tax=unclassified Roseovarius TaxID=2614913 RepID=UPI0012537676|nr:MULTISPECIES: LysR substrate-binding domain-containing protein [unclassified Roseovarius]VVT29819.1 Transcriptional regulator, LysR family protein [Roseovarius sp. EC-SD190]VVT30958.1 Transcriptional regulator, LysR family protein [Roseovarius sp. EC-HK134]